MEDSSDAYYSEQIYLVCVPHYLFFKGFQFVSEGNRMPQYYFDDTFNSLFWNASRPFQNLAGQSCSCFVMGFTDDVSYIVQQRRRVNKLPIGFLFLSQDGSDLCDSIDVRVGVSCSF